MRPRQATRRSLLHVAVLLVAAACGPAAAMEPPPTSLPDGPGSPAASDANPGLAIVPSGGVELYNTRDGSVVHTAQENLVLPINTSGSGWYRLITTCGWPGWAQVGTVDLVTRGAPDPVEEGFDLSGAVIVVDPGHGGRDLGAKGPAGTSEAEVNLAISVALRSRLESSNNIDWNTGSITPGPDYPAVKDVWMTRAPEGPLGGDVELSLAYRAEMANRSGADVLVSVHNNTAPETVGPTPGTDVFYSVGSTGSDRLASLIHEEMIRSLSSRLDEWSSARVTGPKARVDPSSGGDYYGILRRSMSPAVIVEGMYISDPDEEALLNSEEGQRLYADAVYRGIVRFLTTADHGSEIHSPEDFSADVGSATYESCVVPEQSSS